MIEIKQYQRVAEQLRDWSPFLSNGAELRVSEQVLNFGAITAGDDSSRILSIDGRLEEREHRTRTTKWSASRSEMFCLLIAGISCSIAFQGGSFAKHKSSDAKAR